MVNLGEEESDNDLPDLFSVKISFLVLDGARVEQMAATRDLLREHGSSFLARKMKDLLARLGSWIRSSNESFQPELDDKLFHKDGFHNLVDLIVGDEDMDNGTQYKQNMDTKTTSYSEHRITSPNGLPCDRDTSNISFDLTTISNLSFLVLPMTQQYPSETTCRRIRNTPKNLDLPLWVLPRSCAILKHAVRFGTELLESLESILGETEQLFEVEFYVQGATSHNHSKHHTSVIHDAYRQADIEDLLQDINALEMEIFSGEELETDFDNRHQYTGSGETGTITTAQNQNFLQRKTPPQIEKEANEIFFLDQGNSVLEEAIMQGERFVTPIKSKESPSEPLGQLTMQPRSPPRSPHMDSKGMDLSFLSQLPYSMRSEARIAFAANLPRSRSRPCVFMDKWMATKRVAPRMLDTVSPADIDRTVLAELPDDIRALIEAEILGPSKARHGGQQRHRPKRKGNISSFFSAASKKR